MSANISLREGRKKLAALWFSLSGLMLLILVAQSLLGALGQHVVEAWGWFLGDTMPTLSVIAVNIASDADPETRSADAAIEVESFYHLLSMVISGVYLALILVVLIGWRITSYEEPIQVMALSSAWLGPLQGVTLIFISIFFKKAAQAKAEKKAG